MFLSTFVIVTSLLVILIVSPDAQADTALTQGDADAILVNLMAAMGAEGAYTPSAENADLPLTRGALAELLHTLFSE